MSEHPEFFVGNRDPSISDTITVNGTAVDLTGKTVRFKAREAGSSTLLVDQPISNSPDTSGFVRYDWSAADIAAGGILFEPRTALIWWEVTSAAGKTQDVNEAIILVLPHAPSQNTYVELEDFKSTLELTGTTFADATIQNVLEATSRSLEKAYGARWWTTAAAAPDEVRYYTPNGSRLLYIDDLVELTELATDDAGDTSFGTSWTLNTDFVLEPLNASTDGEPWRAIRSLPTSSNYFRSIYPRSVRITGRFGWEETPEGVKYATRLIASQLLKRVKDNPYGIVSFGAEALRISRYDSDVQRAMEPYDRRVPFA